jgi:hypothetical protein
VKSRSISAAAGGVPQNKAFPSIADSLKAKMYDKFIRYKKEGTITAAQRFTGCVRFQQKLDWVGRLRHFLLREIDFGSWSRKFSES